MYWLAKDGDAWDRRHISRFDPRFWTLNFPRPMVGALTTTGSDALACKLVFYRKNDLAGLIWESEDHFDHSLLAYETEKDYRGLVLSFRWQSSNVKALDQVHGPTLTIEGRDSGGMTRSWFVRLWNYASGTPEDAVITLDFDNLDGGFLLPGEADPVYAGDIDRLFLSLVPPDFDGASDGPIEDGGGGFQDVIADVTLTGIQITGARSSLPIGDDYVKPHDLKIANGYDDVFNLTPERVVRNVVQLGYRGLVTHYAGMSHYYSLSWDPGEARFVIDTAKPKLNPATAAWHQDYFSRFAAYDFKVILSLSFELFAADVPFDWQQRTHDGDPALTGWSPPSSLIAPTNLDALTYIRDVYLALADLQQGLGYDPVFQIGEPWWWYQLSGEPEPCFYDTTTEARYLSETGQPVPARHISIFETPDTVQQAYLDWLGDKLGEATLWLRDELKAVHAGAKVTLLFFTPQVLNAAAPMLKTVNMPVDQWSFPAFDFLQIEDYDHVVEGNWAAHEKGLDQVAVELGYGPADSQYFAGFNLLPETLFVWANIDRSISDGLARQYDEILVWAYPQVSRDGFVYFRLKEDDVNGFHEVRFPTDIAFGSSGGPEFSTNVIETASGFESRNINWSEARARYDAGSGLRSEEDVALLLSFFRARQGRAFGFRFKDWSDFKSSLPAAAPSALDQTIGTGDGVTARFPLTKTYTSGGEATVRPIHKPVIGSVNIALDGIEQAAGWLLDNITGEVVFDVPPGSGVSITAGFEFDVPVRFLNDTLDISLETFRAGQAPSIGLVELKL